MSSCPSYELDDVFVQEMFVNRLTEEELASLRVRWEPYRTAIQHALERYDARREECSWRDFRNYSFDFLPYPEWDGAEMLWPAGPLTEWQAWAWEEPALEAMHAVNARLVAACRHLWIPDEKRPKWGRCDQCDAVQISGKPSTRKIWVLRHPPVAVSEA